MATKKREIYARAAVQLRTHDRPRLAEKRCPGCMGLYLYLLIQARGESTHGVVSEAAALESWGSPEKYRRNQLEALIAEGLVERIQTDDGERLHVVKYDEHNDTPEDIAEAKERARVRMQVIRTSRSRSGDVQRTQGEHGGDVPCSISSSLSVSGSRSRSDQPDRSGGPRWSQGATGLEARSAFVEAVSSATGSPFVLGRASFHTADLCDLMNVFAPAESLAAGLEWLRTTVADWVGAADPTYSGGWTPSKLTLWLNAKKPRRRLGSAAEITKQPFDENAPWMKVGA